MMIEVTPDYLLTLMGIERGGIPAPPEVVEQAKERLKLIEDFLENEERGKSNE